MGRIRKSRKARAAADLESVRVVLRRWDPIGVYAKPSPDQGEWAQDEYDRYASRVLSRLADGYDAQRLAGYLGRLRTGSMGLRPNPSNDLRSAAELTKWWGESR
jgi:hypothetical protein